MLGQISVQDVLHFLSGAQSVMFRKELPDGPPPPMHRPRKGAICDCQLVKYVYFMNRLTIKWTSVNWRENYVNCWSWSTFVKFIQFQTNHIWVSSKCNEYSVIDTKTSNMSWIILLFNHRFGGSLQNLKATHSIWKEHKALLPLVKILVVILNQKYLFCKKAVFEYECL